MYTIGGEKGQQIIISENEEKSEFDKILRLAIKCVATMNAQGGNNSKVSYKIEEASLP